MTLVPLYKYMKKDHWERLPKPNDPGEFQEAKGGTFEEPSVWWVDEDGIINTARIRFTDDDTLVGGFV